MNSNNTSFSTLFYCIPRNNEKSFISTNPVEKIRRDIFNEKRITKNARLIEGCEIIDFENRFVEILDLAYNSFLLGMYYATVSLSGLAAERIAYDLIEFQEVRFGSKLIDSKQKMALYNIPYSTLLNFLYEMKEIDKQIKNNLFQINMIRNRYIHPTLEGVPENDAIYTLNLLCRTIDLIIKLKKQATGEVK